jgi:Domain of unknown function (DUF5753)
MRQLFQDQSVRTHMTVFVKLVGLESEASVIRTNAALMPGLFQTADYARTIIAATGPWLTAEEIDRRVAARGARQNAFFGGSQIPRLHVVLDESALKRRVGGPDTMRRQLAALVEASQRPELTPAVTSRRITAEARAG